MKTRDDLVLVGAGGFGREVLWLLREQNELTERYNILGFVDDSNSSGGRVDLPILGDTQWLANYGSKICAVICVGSPKARKAIYDRIKGNPHILFPTIVADDVRRSDSVTFGQGCIICMSTILTINITVNDFVIANLDCTVGHDAIIGDFVTLYPSVNVSGGVRIGDCAEIGTGVNIIQGINICENTIIGAGAVVIRDITNTGTYAGIPARRIDR